MQDTNNGFSNDLSNGNDTPIFGANGGYNEQQPVSLVQAAYNLAGISTANARRKGILRILFFSGLFNVCCAIFLIAFAVNKNYRIAAQTANSAECAPKPPIIHKEYKFTASRKK